MTNINIIIEYLQELKKVPIENIEDVYETLEELEKQGYYCSISPCTDYIILDSTKREYIYNYILENIQEHQVNQFFNTLDTEIEVNGEIYISHQNVNDRHWASIEELEELINWHKKTYGK